MKNTQIHTENQLRKIIKPYNRMLDKRIQTELDMLSMEYIAHTRIAAVYKDDSIQFIPWNNQSLIIHSPTEISLPCDLESDQLSNISLYLLVPGVHHGLRINGSGKVRNGRLIVYIRGIYFQCARAATRAQLWSVLPKYENRGENAVQHFMGLSRFCLLGTKNADGETELSPRGEALHSMIQVSHNRILISERPGNKVAISLRNIIQDPNVTLSFLIPGLNKSLLINGLATISHDSDLLAKLAVNEKPPTLALIIEVKDINVHQEIAFEQVNFWDRESMTSEDELTPFSKAINQHMNGKGLFGKATQKVVSSVIRKDMANLY